MALDLRECGQERYEIQADLYSDEGKELDSIRIWRLFSPSMTSDSIMEAVAEVVLNYFESVRGFEVSDTTVKITIYPGKKGL